jgi:hypothetical protein
VKTLLLATAAAIIAAAPAFGANLITFAQIANTNEVFATVNGTDTQTTMTANGAVSIGQLITGSPPAVAFFTLDATSIDPANTVATAVIQHYSGSFCVSTGVGCTGTNVLSGTFSDAAFGALTGPGLVVNVNNPPDVLVLSSDVIPAGDLIAPNAFGLTFTNLVPGLSVVGTTIAPFDATFAGDASANVAVIEPSSLAILGLGVIGLGFVTTQKRRTPLA